MDIGGPTVPAAPQAQAAAASNLDLLGGGLDGLVRHLNSRFIQLKNDCQLKVFFYCSSLSSWVERWEVLLLQFHKLPQDCWVTSLDLLLLLLCMFPRR